MTFIVCNEGIDFKDIMCHASIFTTAPITYAREVFESSFLNDLDVRLRVQANVGNRLFDPKLIIGLKLELIN